MANLVTFAKKLWKDATSGGTPITAAELNRVETGISDCATQINALGDSVYPGGRIVKLLQDDSHPLQISVVGYVISFTADGISMWDINNKRGHSIKWTRQ